MFSVTWSKTRLWTCRVGFSFAHRPVTGCTGTEPESRRSRNKEKGGRVGGRQGGKRGSSETKTLALLCRRLHRQRCRPLPKSWGSTVQRQRQGRANPNLAKTIGAKDNHLPVLLRCLISSLRPREWQIHRAIAANTTSTRRRRQPTTKPPTLMNPAATSNTQRDPTAGPRTSCYSS